MLVLLLVEQVRCNAVERMRLMVWSEMKLCIVGALECVNSLFIYGRRGKWVESFPSLRKPCIYKCRPELQDALLHTRPPPMCVGDTPKSSGDL